MKRDGGEDEAGGGNRGPPPVHTNEPSGAKHTWINHKPLLGAVGAYWRGLGEQLRVQTSHLIRRWRSWKGLSHRSGNFYTIETLPIKPSFFFTFAMGILPQITLLQNISCSGNVIQTSIYFLSIVVKYSHQHPAKVDTWTTLLYFGRNKKSLQHSSALSVDLTSLHISVDRWVIKQKALVG